MTTAPPAPVHAPVSERDRTVIYLSILLALFLAALDQTIVATALPRMVEDLEGVERYAWVATAYLLMSTALALVYGKLADTYPRKFVTLGAVGLFLGGSVLCGLAGEFGDLPLLGNAMSQLVIFRGIQGAGGGGLFAMTFIVIADLFTPAERGKYQGFVGAVFGVASVLGPLIGGLLTDHAGGWITGIEGWRWVFYVNVPLGGVAVWFIIRRMPRLDPPVPQARPDLLGAALLVGGLIPLTLSLQVDKRRYPWLPGVSPGADATAFASWVTTALFVGGCVLLALFIMRSRTSAGPILDLRLFRDPVFRRVNASTFFMGASFISVTIFLPLFLVNVLGVSATRAGAALIPFSLGLVFGATLAGQIVAKVGYRKQIVLGAVLFFVAALLLAGMESDIAYWQITLYMVMCGVGVGPGMPLFTLAIQNAAAVRLIGQATSASQFFRQMGATVGAALMGTVLGVTLASSFAEIGVEVGPLTNGAVVVEEHVSTGGAELPAVILTSFEERAGRSESEQQARAIRAEGDLVAVRVGASVRDAFRDATQRIYWLTAIMIAIGGGLAMRIPELPLRTTHDRAAATANSGLT